ncbi:MAG: hypothetical protein K2Y23_00655 [Cyanobacteria bacterium]|nr:hypothetical protein [Cyanobacteriota bacterium]
MSAALQSLIGSVRRSAPDLVDEWEATAWVESFGWTDERIRHAFGLNDTRALGRHIFELRDRRKTMRQEARAFVRRAWRMPLLAGAYSRTLVYALPWLVMFAIEAVWPDAFGTRPEMAGPISVAVMISLISTGGYVQAIARKGSFYLGMNQIVLARHVGLLLCRGGVITTMILALSGFAAGEYFDVFGSTAARLVATAYFVMLSMLWLACAMVSLVQPRWRVPVIYLGGGAVFLVARAVFHSSTLTAHTLALIGSVVIAAVVTVEAFRGSRQRDTRTERVVLPRTPVLLHSLLPHFVYGIAYFTFLFADRLSAGSALPLVSGLPFGITPDYKRGIDLAFLVFLLVAGGVECCNLAIMRAWRRDAKTAVAGAAVFVDRLNHRRRLSLAIIVGLFVVLSVTAAVIAGRVSFLIPGSSITFAAGCFGYALFAIGLLDALLLFSVNRPGEVLRALLPALLLNLAGGYAFSHIAGANYAVAGLVFGAALFAVRARQGVTSALRRPDFAYAWA